MWWKKQQNNWKKSGLKPVFALKNLGAEAALTELVLAGLHLCLWKFFHQYRAVRIWSYQVEKNFNHMSDTQKKTDTCFDTCLTSRVLHWAVLMWFWVFLAIQWTFLESLNLLMHFTNICCSGLGLFWHSICSSQLYVHFDTTFNFFRSL